MMLGTFERKEIMISEFCLKIIYEHDITTGVYLIFLVNQSAGRVISKSYQP